MSDYSDRTIGAQEMWDRVHRLLVKERDDEQRLYDRTCDPRYDGGVDILNRMLDLLGEMKP